MYRRTTIAATAIALTLIGGGSALAANAGLFGGERPDGAGTLPAVASLDTGSAGDDGAASSPSTTEVAPSPAARGDDSPDRAGEQESHEQGEVEVEDDD